MIFSGSQSKSTIKQSINVPLITVITVVRNGSSTLEQTILSVINQTYKDIKYIIVDGASTDNTIDIIKKYEDSIDYWISEPDNGIYDAMNKGIRLATGEWLIFMNSGDFFFSDNVCLEFSTFANDSVDIYYGDVCLDDRRIVKAPERINSLFFLMERMICHQSIFARRKLFEMMGFNTKYRIVADRDWLSNFIRSGHKAVHIPLIICCYDTHGVSSNSSTYSKDSFTLVKDTYGYLGLFFVKCKRLLGNILKLLGLKNK
jgi:glycosyltransferase involved in cell wall biosynthesis